MLCSFSIGHLATLHIVNVTLPTLVFSSHKHSPGIQEFLFGDPVHSILYNSRTSSHKGNVTQKVNNKLPRIVLHTILKENYWRD